VNPAMPVPFDVKLMNLAASALFALGFAVFAAAGVWWALRHPVFSIAGITVQGEVTHNSAPTLRTNVAPQLAGNFFTIDLAAARKAFQSVPWVRQAIVKRDFPNRLRVLLEEHHAAALWGNESESKLLNDKGEVFEANIGDVEQAALPRLAGPDAHAALQAIGRGHAQARELELAARHDLGHHRHHLGGADVEAHDQILVFLRHRR